MKVSAVIPCFNEEPFIRQVVMQSYWQVDEVIVVDDKSSDGTVDAARECNAIVSEAQGDIKRGAGAATRRGIRLALLNGADIIVTLDGDGQHNPMEIKGLLEPLAGDDCDLVVGCRDNMASMPRYRRFGNKVIAWFFNVLSRRKLEDAQCCFRAFKRSVLEEMEIEECGFGFSTEMLIKARAKGWRIKEVPVSCVYHRRYSENSTLNPVIHGLDVIRATVVWRLRAEFLPFLQHLGFRFLKVIVRPFIGTGVGKMLPPLRWLYKGAARFLIPEAEKTVDLGGYRLRVRVGRDRDIDGIGQRLIFGGCYEPTTTQVVRSLVKDGMRCVDVGANIGYYSLLFSSLVGERGKVWAFEPEPTNFGELLKNIELNGASNIVVSCKAISHRSGRAKLYVSPTESGAHSLIPCRRQNKGAIEVELATLDGLFYPHTPIDFLKVDTEGNDMLVVAGGEFLLRNGGPILVIEFWPQGLLSALCSPLLFWCKLETLGFEHIYLIDEFRGDVRRASYNDVDSYCRKHGGFSANLLCSKKPVREVE